MNLISFFNQHLKGRYNNQSLQIRKEDLDVLLVYLRYEDPNEKREEREDRQRRWRHEREERGRREAESKEGRERTRDITATNV